LFLIDASEDSDATSTKTKQSDKEYEAKQIWKQYFAKIKVENPDKVADSAIWDMYSQILLRECSVSPANATDEHYVKFIAYCNGKINS
jgi:cellobiose phosphorylase